jgi:hypothetical protein
MMPIIADLSEADRKQLFHPLLRHLSNHLLDEAYPLNSYWQRWQIRRILGGANNLLYWVAGQPGEFAVKFTIRDARDRAGREYQTLLALHQQGLNIAPLPILLDRDNFTQPVVVQTWLQGEVSAQPPETNAEWRSLLRHFVTIRTLTPAKTTVELSPAFHNCHSAVSGKAAIQQQLNYIPPAERPITLQKLVEQVEVTPFPSWPVAPVALCRVDPNISNFIRRPGPWASVDWENSGWGDPAFEIADLMTHPAYLAIPPSRWTWLVETYCNLVKDPTAAIRIRVYHCIMLVWWVARLARFLYEVPRGLDQRLVKPFTDWQTDREVKYQHYLALAWQMGRRDWGW